MRAAESSAAAARFDRDTAQVTLVSGVATSYFDVLALRTRLAIARDNLAIAQQVLDLVSARARNGAASALDVSRQQATVLSQQAALLPLEQQERQTLAALAVLVGRPPEGFDVKGTEIADLSVPEIDPGLPAELLLRRPDLASAEAQLAAANADVAAARAALLPSITLTGTAGLATSALTSLATGGTTAAIGIAASLLQPIFDGGRLRGQKAIAESRERELVETYRKAILSAFADVEQALAGTSRLGQQEASAGRGADPGARVAAARGDPLSRGRRRSAHRARRPAHALRRAGPARADRAQPTAGRGEPLQGARRRLDRRGHRRAGGGGVTDPMLSAQARGTTELLARHRLPVDVLGDVVCRSGRPCGILSGLQ